LRTPAPERKALQTAGATVWMRLQRALSEVPQN
jgi:hypothetical protein